MGRSHKVVEAAAHAERALAQAQVIKPAREAAADKAAHAARIALGAEPWLLRRLLQAEARHVEGPQAGPHAHQQACQGKCVIGQYIDLLAALLRSLVRLHRCNLAGVRWGMSLHECRSYLLAMYHLLLCDLSEGTSGPA